MVHKYLNKAGQQHKELIKIPNKKITNKANPIYRSQNHKQKSHRQSLP